MNTVYKNITYKEVSDRIKAGEYIGCECMSNFLNKGERIILVFGRHPRIIPVKRSVYSTLTHEMQRI